jgi:NAD(P) transhydrogenase
LRQRGLYGIDYSLKENLTIKDFMYRERRVVRKERKMIMEHIDHHDIDFIHGEASLKDAHTICIKSSQGEQEIYGKYILIATGSSPHHPPEVPFDHELICDSDSILNIKRLPRTMAVVGGAIGTEYLDFYSARYTCHADRANQSFHLWIRNR